MAHRTWKLGKPQNFTFCETLICLLQLSFTQNLQCFSLSCQMIVSRAYKANCDPTLHISGRIEFLYVPTKTKFQKQNQENKTPPRIIQCSQLTVHRYDSNYTRNHWIGNQRIKINSELGFQEQICT